MAQEKDEHELIDQWDRMLPNFESNFSTYRTEELNEASISQLKSDFQDAIDLANQNLPENKKIKLINLRGDHELLPSFLLAFSHKQIQFRITQYEILGILTEMCDFDLKQKQLFSAESCSDGGITRLWKLQDQSIISHDSLIQYCLNALMRGFVS